MVAVVALAGTVSAPRVPAAAPVYMAVREAGGVVRLFIDLGGVRTALGGDVDGAEWRRIEPRRSAGSNIQGIQEIRESAPRLILPGGIQLIAYDRPFDGPSGLCRLTAAGITTLVSSSDGASRLVDEGTALSHDGARLAMVLEGADLETVVVLEIGLAAATTRRVAGLETIDDGQLKRIEPRSLTLSANALFFAAESKRGTWSLFRVGLGTQTLTPTAEKVAGPFEAISRYGVASESAAVYLAGASDTKLDALLVRESGLARNITEAPTTMARHTVESPRLAVSHDANEVAYHIEMDSGPETYVHDTTVPGPAGRRHITADARFNPYIDQESLIFFTRGSQLVFAAGHDPVTVDIYRVDSRFALDASVINLTRTGSGLVPPFLTKGTLSPETALPLPGERVLVSATGFGDGVADRLQLLDAAGGVVIAEAPGAHAASDFFYVGADLYFTADTPGATRALLRLRGDSFFEIGRSAAANPPRPFVILEGRAFATMPTIGMLELTPDAEPRLVCYGDTFAQGGAITRDGTQLVMGTVDAASGTTFYIVDIASGAKRPVTNPSVIGEVLAIGDPLPDPEILRGDANGDRAVDISDAIYTLGALFLGTADVSCADAMDANDDGGVNISDPIFTLFFLMAAGTPPPAPFPQPGPDPTPDALGCTGRS